MSDKYKKATMSFRPRARIMLQLGEQLIKNESIALLELVKNSYDADASVVNVIMNDIENPDNGSIIIEDNGTGMDLDTVKDVWMEPGSDNKEKQFIEKKRSKKYNRLPLGEKGIGRFGAHKMGRIIELVTRQNNKPEVYLTIDWTRFEGHQYLNEVSINITEREPVVFVKTSHGTRITIKKLKDVWTRGTVRDIHRSLNSLCSPFSNQTPDSFMVNFCLGKNQEWLEDLITWKEIEETALYHIRCSIQEDHITKFTYEFRPWTIMDKLKKRKVNEKDEHFQKLNRMVQRVEKKIVPLDLSRFEIGQIHFEALIFDRTPKILALGVQDKKGFKEYLDQNGGIRVYRDGVRVYDYGEPGNDWLNLDVRRVNVPTKRISNNIILGAVHIDRDNSHSLLEKTNREGFIENEAYQYFKAAVLYTLGVIETFRYPDKEKLQNLYGTTAKSEPVLATINELRDYIEKKVDDVPARKEILKYVDRIEHEYQDISEVLLKSAGAGLS